MSRQRPWNHKTWFLKFANFSTKLGLASTLMLVTSFHNSLFFVQNALIISWLFVSLYIYSELLHCKSRNWTYTSRNRDLHGKYECPVSHHRWPTDVDGESEWMKSRNLQSTSICSISKNIMDVISLQSFFSSEKKQCLILQPHMLCELYPYDHLL